MSHELPDLDLEGRRRIDLPTVNIDTNQYPEILKWGLENDLVEQNEIFQITKDVAGALRRILPNSRAYLNSHEEGRRGDPDTYWNTLSCLANAKECLGEDPVDFSRLEERVTFSVPSVGVFGSEDEVPWGLVAKNVRRKRWSGDNPHTMVPITQQMIDDVLSDDHLTALTQFGALRELRQRGRAKPSVRIYQTRCDMTADELREKIYSVVH